MPKTKGEALPGTLDKAAKAEATWQEYERRKQALQRVEMPAAEYEQHIKRIVDELGI